MRHRLATYIETPFPYPTTYQADGFGNLIATPRLRIPTSIVQGHRGPIADAGGLDCGCGGDCKRLQGRRRGLGWMGECIVDPVSGIPISCDPVDTSSSGSDASSTGGCSIDAECSGDLICSNGACVPPPSSLPTAAGGGTAATRQSIIPQLINAGATAAGKIYASTHGITPQQFALQNPQLSPAQAMIAYQQQLAARQPVNTSSVGSFFTQNFYGIPVWGWGLGVVALGVLFRSSR